MAIYSLLPSILKVKSISKCFLSSILFISLSFLFQNCSEGEKTKQIPLETKFTKKVLVSNLLETTGFTFMPDGTILITEKAGAIKQYDPTTRKTTLINTINCRSNHEKGLLGIVTDNDFEKNHYIYLFYSPAETPLYNKVSRFTFGPKGVDISSELVLVTITSDMAGHQGGSLSMDSKGNLFISSGDDSQAGGGNGMTPGYSSMDERPEFMTFDAQRSSSNTNDFRGKILRIKPTRTGYEIPEGNLFPVGQDSCRPEIYVMGCRNPFRTYIDPKTDLLYWGEVGPDAGGDGPRGPRGYDEINRTDKSGYFGWPLFIANNKPYNKIAPVSVSTFGPFDVKAPLNLSIHNKGKQRLPVPTEAIFYYPYLESKEFPKMGKGGRTAMAGFIYHYSGGYRSPYKFPAYYDNKFFFFDWMRNTIYTFDAYAPKITNEILEQFLPSFQFKKPVKMDIGPDGNVYLLEFGSLWLGSNDGTLSVLEYHQENMAPEAKANIVSVSNQSPYEVKLSGAASTDPENDSLKYVWFNGNEQVGEGKNISLTFSEPSLYAITLKVKDKDGKFSENDLKINVGNSAPVVNIIAEGEGSFFRSGALNYTTKVADLEDNKRGKIDTKTVRSALFFIPGNLPFENYTQSADILQYNARKIAKLDCYACHAVNKKNVGPSFKDIASKYEPTDANILKLAQKVISGGNGVWGEAIMSAHPQLKEADAKQIVNWILSQNLPDSVIVPASGTIEPQKLFATHVKGNYLLKSVYSDQPVGKAISNTKEGFMLLRNIDIDPNYFSESRDIIIIDPNVRFLFPTSFISFEHVSIDGVKSIEVTYNTENNGDSDAIEAMWFDGKARKSLGKGSLIARSKDNTSHICYIPITATKGEGTLEFYLRQTPSVHAHIPLENIRLILGPDHN